MSTLDILLMLDRGQLELPKQEVEITRLTKKTGKAVIFELTGIEQDRLVSIHRQSTTTVDGKRELDVNYRRRAMIYEGISKPELSNPQLQKQFNSEGVEPYEIVSNLFTPSEQLELEEIISELSGLGDVEPIKVLKKK